MKKLSLSLLSLFAIILTLSSCELVGDIFKAGVWVGVLVVVGIIVLVIALLRKMF